MARLTLYPSSSSWSTSDMSPVVTMRPACAAQHSTLSTQVSSTSQDAGGDGAPPARQKLRAAPTKRQRDRKDQLTRPHLHHMYPVGANVVQQALQ